MWSALANSGLLCSKNNMTCSKLVILFDFVADRGCGTVRVQLQCFHELCHGVQCLVHLHKSPWLITSLSLYHIGRFKYKSLWYLLIFQEQTWVSPAQKSLLFVPRIFRQLPRFLWWAATDWGSHEEGPRPPSDSQADPCLAVSWQRSQSRPARRPERRPVETEGETREYCEHWERTCVKMLLCFFSRTFRLSFSFFDFFYCYVDNILFCCIMFFICYPIK